MGREGGRSRKSRGRGGFDDDSPFDGGGWSPPTPSTDFAPRQQVASSFGPEVQATVKWFNADKGFGFVELADGTGDAFLHANILERAGSKGVTPGAALRVRTGPGQKGLQVTEVLEITPGSAPPPQRSSFGGGGSRPDYRSGGGGGGGGSYGGGGAVLGEDVRGTVKWYNSEKGFGFIAPEDGGKDVFVHATALERSGMPALSEGQRVTMRVIQGKKGPEAGTVQNG